ncbi:dihydropteroate synthase [unidentified bacterial endosymbiont]|uniref:dihydropteroate synthase n=1 Tax=unidentified bacterial endosymbiont TaxID=2355 RepID=UPI0020A20FD5|nr:dihydropteroate synthase [unidentified bacterial endosymbiont]
MGILNVTPDSFFDRGRYQSIAAALRQVEQMIAAGASIIDIGGESTRPGAVPVPLQEELHRVMPILEAIVARFDVWVSVDTYKPEVMLAAAAAGANLINDIMALRYPGALTAAAATGLPVCLMHRLGESVPMQKPHYQRLLPEIIDFFHERLACCEAGGIPRARLLLDPGFGFDKALQHNYQLLGQLATLKILACPLLIGLSHKLMIRQVVQGLPDPGPSGSVAAAVIAVMQGAQIVRVHDVRETVEALRVASAVLEAQSSIALDSLQEVNHA